MRGFYHEAIRLLTVYAAQKNEYREQMLTLFLENTKREDDPLTRLLVHIIETCGGRISCAIARMYTVFYKRSKGGSGVKTRQQSSTLDLQTNFVVSKLLETCVVFEIGVDYRGETSVQKQYRPDHLQFFMQLLDTLASDLSASARKQRDIYRLLFQKEIFNEEQIVTLIADTWFTQEEACSWNRVGIFETNGDGERDKIDVTKAKKAITEIDTEFLTRFGEKQQKQVSDHYSLAKHQELLAEFSAYWLGEDTDPAWKKPEKSKPVKNHPDWGLSGRKKLALFFYDHFLQIAAMLTRGNSPSIFELEQTLKRWVSTTTPDRVTSEKGSHEDLGKASELLLLNFLQDKPITKTQRDTISQHEAKSTTTSKSRLVDTGRSVIKFKGPVLKFLMATFLDSTEFRQKSQLRADQARQEKKGRPEATGGGDDVSGGDGQGDGEGSVSPRYGTGASADDGANEDSEAAQRESSSRAQRYEALLQFSVRIFTDIYANAKALQATFPTADDVSRTDASGLSPDSPCARAGRDLSPTQYRKRYRKLEVFSNYGDPSYLFDDLLPFLLTYCDVWLGNDEDDDDNADDSTGDTDGDGSINLAERRNLIDLFPGGRDSNGVATGVRGLFDRTDSEFAKALIGLYVEFDFSQSAFAPSRTKAKQQRADLAQLIRRLALGDPTQLATNASQTADSVYKSLVDSAKIALKKKEATESKKEQSASDKGSAKLNQEWKMYNDLLGTFGNDQIPDSDGGTVGFTEEGQHVIHPFKLILQEAMGYQIATEGEPLIPVSEEMAAAAAGASSSGGGDDSSGASGADSSAGGEAKKVRFGTTVARQIMSRMMIYLARESNLSTEADMDTETYLNQKRATLIMTELLKRKTWRGHFEDKRGSLDGEALDLHRFNCQRSLGFYFAGVEMLVHHLSMARDTEVMQYPRTMELIAATTEFGMRLLEGGNRETQDKVLDTVIAAQEGVHANSATAYFLNGACNLLRYLGQQLVSGIDDEDGSSGRFFRSMLRLLQELCDGNNERMQVMIHVYP
eukprot:COSAG06_NODE_1379_length_9637_cov_95.702663_1_plen_1025_part_10